MQALRFDKPVSVSNSGGTSAGWGIHAGLRNCGRTKVSLNSLFLRSLHRGSIIGKCESTKPRPSRNEHAPTKKLLPVGATLCRDGFSFLPIQNPSPSRGEHAPTKKLLPVGATLCRDGFSFSPIQYPSHRVASTLLRKSSSP